MLISGISVGVLIGMGELCVDHLILVLCRRFGIPCVFEEDFLGFFDVVWCNDFLGWWVAGGSFFLAVYTWFGGLYIRRAE